MEPERLLVFNSHEAWVHQLEGIGWPLDIVVGLPGRVTRGWDTRMRPLPAGARLVELTQLPASSATYVAAITHGTTDLLDVKQLDVPKLVVLHTTIEGRILESGAWADASEMGALLRQLLSLIGGHAMAVSELKGRSWGLTDDVVPFAVDVDAYEPSTLELPEGLRISNLFNKRRKILLGDFHDRAFGGLPLLLVGHNPDVPASRTVSSWDELKSVMHQRRFFVHTADPQLEDGYNMATLEAMAAGLPILGNRHPTSPVQHGISGFLSDDPSELRACAERLLADRGLARRWGARARETVAADFRMDSMHVRLRSSIEQARQNHRFLRAG